MSFTNSVALAFTITSIQKNAPTASGVYGLSNARAWLYVGETDNIQWSLMQHAQEAPGASNENTPTGFSFELSPANGRKERQDRLIVELAPTRNQNRNERAGRRA